MQLLNLEMEGFGKFSDNTDINFTSGLNFINGLNESGKSTILEGIMASIFKYNSRQIEPFYCWNNEHVCKVALTYENDNKEIFRITSDYKNNIRKLEKNTNKDFNQISSIEKNILPYIKNHFGFNDKKVLENTSIIRQSQMAILEDLTTKSKIKDMIEEVLAGRSEVSATKTIKNLKKFSKDTNKNIFHMVEKHDTLEEELNYSKDVKSRISKQNIGFEDVSERLKQKNEQLVKLDKNKKLYDEKESLLNKKNNLDAQVKNIDDFIKTLNEKKPETNIVQKRKIIPVSYVATGITISVLSFLLSFPIGYIFGIPLIIFGLYQLFKKPEKTHILKQDNSEQIVQYQEKKNGLINKLAVIENRLEDYKLVNFTIDDFSDLEQLKKTVEEMKEKKIELKTTVTTTKDLVQDPEDIQERLDEIVERISDLENKIQEHDLAAKFLEMAQTEVQQKLTPTMERDSKNILKEVTNDHYKDIKIDEQSLDISIKVPEKNDYVDASNLSQGASDQVYFTLRTVLVNLLCGDLNIPLILDDPFHNFDEIRLKRTLKTINKISKEKQIILISHRPYHDKYNDFAANIIDLK